MKNSPEKPIEEVVKCLPEDLPQSEVKKLTDFIEDNELPRAFVELEKVDCLRSRVERQKELFGRIQADYRGGLIEDKVYIRSINRIRQALLYFIDKGREVDDDPFENIDNEPEVRIPREYFVQLQEMMIENEYQIVLEELEMYGVKYGTKEFVRGVRGAEGRLSFLQNCEARGINKHTCEVEMNKLRQAVYHLVEEAIGEEDSFDVTTEELDRQMALPEDSHLQEILDTIKGGSLEIAFKKIKEFAHINNNSNMERCAVHQLSRLYDLRLKYGLGMIDGEKEYLQKYDQLQNAALSLIEQEDVEQSDTFAELRRNPPQIPENLVHIAREVYSSSEEMKKAVYTALLAAHEQGIGHLINDAIELASQYSWLESLGEDHAHYESQRAKIASELLGLVSELAEQSQS